MAHLNESIIPSLKKKTYSSVKLFQTQELITGIIES